MAKRYQVIIVGGGPVGVALAVELGMRGISCALVESRTELGSASRRARTSPSARSSISISGHRRGAARRALHAAGLPDRRDHRLRQPEEPVLARAGRAASWSHDFYFQRNDRLPQYQMEKVLRAEMATLPKVESRVRLDRHHDRAGRGGVRVAMPSRTAHERGARGRLRGRLRRRPFASCASRSASPRSGHDFDQLMVLVVLRSRELHEELGKRFPPKSTYRAMHPDLKGYWQFFGRIDVGEGLFFHAPVPARHHARQFRFPRPAAGGRRLPVRLRVRSCRLLGPAGRGRRALPASAACSSPATPRTAIRPTAASASTTAWRTRSTSAGSSRRSSTAGAATTLLRLLRRGAPADLRARSAKDFIAARIGTTARSSSATARNATSAEFEAGLAGAGERRRQPRAGLRAELRGLAGGDRPARRRSTAHGQHVFAARAGHHLAPQKLVSGRNVFEELGRGFTLLAFDADDAACRRSSRLRAALEVPLKVVRDSYADGREDTRRADPGAARPVRRLDRRRGAPRRRRHHAQGRRPRLERRC